MWIRELLQLIALITGSYPYTYPLTPLMPQATQVPPNLTTAEPSAALNDPKIREEKPPSHSHIKRGWAWQGEDDPLISH